VTTHIESRVPEIIAADDSDDDTLLTSRELAAWLKVSLSWVEQSRHRGDGPPVQRLGPTLLRYRVGDVKSWLLARTARNAQRRRHCSVKADEAKPTVVAGGQAKTSGELA
jgi:predicted DNA-binding transcriptional regulator AlpA